MKGDDMMGWNMDLCINAAIEQLGNSFVGSHYQLNVWPEVHIVHDGTATDAQKTAAMGKFPEFVHVRFTVGDRLKFKRE